MAEVTEKNLMINYVPRDLTQEEFRKIFEQIGDIHNCRLMIKKDTGESMGYGFVTYTDPSNADLAIEKLHGMHLHGKHLKVAFAKKADGTNSNDSSAGSRGGQSGGSGGSGGGDGNVYIAGLPSSTEESDLLKLFSPFGGIAQSKVLPNPKGDGPRIAFVRFNKFSDAQDAIAEMNDKSVPGAERPLTVKMALKTDKDRQGGGQGGHRGQDRYNPMQNQNSMALSAIQMKSMNNQQQPAAAIPSQILITLAQSGISCPHSSGHSNIVTGEVYSLYVYGLPPDANETTLYELFCPFGGILNVRPIFDLQKENKPCKGFGFVNFRKYVDACQALVAMDGFVYEGKSLRVSFKDDKNNMGPPQGAVGQILGAQQYVQQGQQTIQVQNIGQHQLVQQQPMQQQIQHHQMGQQSIPTLGQNYQQNNLQQSRGGLGGRGIQPMKY